MMVVIAWASWPFSSLPWPTLDRQDCQQSVCIFVIIFIISCCYYYHGCYYLLLLSQSVYTEASTEAVSHTDTHLIILHCALYRARQP